MPKKTDNKIERKGAKIHPDEKKAKTLVHKNPKAKKRVKKEIKEVLKRKFVNNLI